MCVRMCVDRASASGARMAEWCIKGPGPAYYKMRVDWSRLRLSTHTIRESCSTPESVLCNAPPILVGWWSEIDSRKYRAGHV